jgi:hypothetical protein
VTDERYVDPDRLEAARQAAHRSLARIEDPDARDAQVVAAAEVAGQVAADDLREWSIGGTDIADDLDGAVAFGRERFALRVYEELARLPALGS